MSRRVIGFGRLRFRTGFGPSCLSSGLVEFLAQFGAFTCVATLGTVYGEILSNLRVHGAKDTKDMPREAMTVLYSRRHEGREGGPMWEGWLRPPFPANA